MPTDANILAGIQWPNTQSPTSVYSQQLGLQQKQLETQQQREQLADAAIKRQQSQRQLDAAQAMANAITNNSTVNDDGSVAVNYPAAMKHLADAGFGPEVLKLDAQRREDLTSAQKLIQEQVATNGAKAGRISSWLSTIPTVDYAETDPNKLQAQSAAAQTAYASAAQGMLNEGLLPPEVAAAERNRPYTPDVQAQVQQQIKAAYTAEQQQKNLAEHVKNLHEQAMFKSQEDEANAKADEAGTKATAAQRSEAISTMPVFIKGDDKGNITSEIRQANQEALDQWRQKQPAAIQAMIPLKWSPQNEIAIRRQGLTTEQQQTGDLAQQREAREAAANTETVRHNKAEEGAKGQDLENKRRELDPFGLLNPQGPAGAFV